MKIILSYIFLSFTSSASASEWWYVSDTKDGAINFVDVERYVREGTMAKIWTYTIFADSHLRLISQKTRDVLNCSTRTIRSTTIVSYRKDGTIGSLSENGVAEEVAPDTVAEHILRFACAPALSRPRF